MATQRTKAGAPSLVNVASISLRGGTDQEEPMTDITYQTTTIGIADQSALLSRITAWCTHFAEGVREGVLSSPR